MKKNPTTNYCIVKTADAIELRKKVDGWLADGWELAGGISIAVDHFNATHFAQALVKRESAVQAFFDAMNKKGKP